MAEGFTGRETLLMLLAVAIAIMFLKGGAWIWQSRLYPGISLIVLGSVLTYFFFRRRFLVFLIAVLVFLIVNVGSTALFHPSVAGYLITAGAIAGLYLLIRWHTAKYPHLGRKDMHKLFDNDAGS